MSNWKWLLFKKGTKFRLREVNMVAKMREGCGENWKRTSGYLNLMVWLSMYYRLLDVKVNYMGNGPIMVEFKELWFVT